MIANRTREWCDREVALTDLRMEIRPSGMKRGACGNVRYGLMTIGHATGNGGHIGSQQPTPARAAFLSQPYP